MNHVPANGFVEFGQAVEAEWLAELGPMFFSVKESYKTRLEKRAREREDKAKMELEMKEAETRSV